MEDYVWGSIRGASDKTELRLTVVPKAEEEEDQGWQKWKKLRRMAKKLKDKSSSRRRDSKKFRGWRNKLDSILVRSHSPVFLN